jgi:hypothetical protein
MRRTRILAAVTAAAAVCTLALPAAAASASVRPAVTTQNCAVNGRAALSLQNFALGDGTRAVNVFGSHVPGSLADGRTYSVNYANEDEVNQNLGLAGQPYESVYQFSLDNPGVLSAAMVGKYKFDFVLTDAFAPLGHVYPLYVTWVPNHGIHLEGNPLDPHALWIIDGSGAMINGASANPLAPTLLTIADNKYTSGPNKGRWRLYAEGAQQQGGLGNLADAQTWTADFCGPVSLGAR